MIKNIKIIHVYCRGKGIVGKVHERFSWIYNYDFKFQFTVYFVQNTFRSYY